MKMGCFPACFGHLKHKQIMKDVQDQCLSPSPMDESAKLLAATIDSPKEEDILKLVPESYNGATVSDHSISNLNNELTSRSSNNDEETEKERIEHKSDESESKKSSFLIDEEEDCMTKEITFVREESSDSLFSLSIDSRRQVFAAVEKEDKEVNSPLVLVRSCDVLKYDKENDPIPIIKQEIGVDTTTSLSSWLVASEKSNMDSSSPQSEKNYGHGEREILGAIRITISCAKQILSGDQLGTGGVSTVSVCTKV